MIRLLIFVGPRGFESAWKARDDPQAYELVIVDQARQLTDTVIAVAVPEWYADLDALVLEATRTLDKP